MSSSMSLTGKTAWVTGSSRGIGRVVASHLASLGASVAVHGTSPFSTRAFNEADSLDAVASAITAQHDVETLAVHGDLTKEQEVRRTAGEIRAGLGQIDILVNCAGADVGAAGIAAPQAGRPQDNDAVFISLTDMETVLDRNLKTTILPCREVAPDMMDRRSGRIVNVSSTAALQGLREGAIYATAKAAVNEYSRCLAVLLRPYNVPVNVVAPGETVTTRFLASRAIDESKMIEDGTLERYGRPMDVARAVAFLVSDSSTHITGQVLRVDGGAQCWAS